MANPMPFAPGAIRKFLIDDPQITAIVPAESIATRDLPEVIDGPFITLRAPGNVGVDPMLRRPMVQIDVWCPKIEILGGTTDPEEHAWDIAALAGERLVRAKAQSFRNSTWRAQWTDGPITFVDIKRGPDFPLYRATVRVEMKMTVR